MNELVLVSEFALLFFCCVFLMAWAINSAAKYIKKRLENL